MPSLVKNRRIRPVRLPKHGSPSQVLFLGFAKLWLVESEGCSAVRILPEHRSRKWFLAPDRHPDPRRIQLQLK